LKSFLPVLTKPAELPEQLNEAQSAEVSTAPLVVIEPTHGVFGINYREIWQYRELLYFLTWRDVKVRYKQTLLGLVWVVLQPLLMTLIFTVFLGRVLRVPSNNIPYPLFAYAGLMVWSFFATATATVGNSLVTNAHLITKVFFPRVLIPISSVLGRLVDLVVAFVILIVLMIYYRVHMSISLLTVPFLVFLLASFTLGLGMWLAAVNIKYRDVALAIPVLLQLGMFITPVVYPLSLVPPKWQLIYSLNPMVGIVEGLRTALFNLPFDTLSLTISIVVSVLLFLYGSYVFRRREAHFADIV